MSKVAVRRLTAPRHFVGKHEQSNVLVFGQM
jgi:hypothetical protein